MKKAIFLIAIGATTLLLQSCDAYSSAVSSAIDAHNRLAEKHNQFAEGWNRYQ